MACPVRLSRVALLGVVGERTPAGRQTGRDDPFRGKLLAGRGAPPRAAGHHRDLERARQRLERAAPSQDEPAADRAGTLAAAATPPPRQARATEEGPPGEGGRGAPSRAVGAGEGPARGESETTTTMPEVDAAPMTDGEPSAPLSTPSQTTTTVSLAAAPAPGEAGAAPEALPRSAGPSAGAPATGDPAAAPDASEAPAAPPTPSDAPTAGTRSGDRVIVVQRGPQRVAIGLIPPEPLATSPSGQGAAPVARAGSPTGPAGPMPSPVAPRAPAAAMAALPTAAAPGPSLAAAGPAPVSQAAALAVAAAAETASRPGGQGASPAGSDDSDHPATAARGRVGTHPAAEAPSADRTADLGAAPVAARSREMARAAQTASTASEGARDADARARIVDQVLARLDSMRLASGRQEVLLRLDPPHLGELRLTILRHGDAISAHVVAETQAAREALTAGRDDLRSALETRGFSLQQLDVALQQGGGGARHYAFRQGDPGDGAARSDAAIRLARAPSGPAAAGPARAFRSGVGAVDYTA
ncbi:MAG: flagellar hook-length control protein FliK [Chthonomonadales bacterium]|nr:flagellar hook-length control protein FliK [Chthonomonadales bacterium]